MLDRRLPELFCRYDDIYHLAPVPLVMLQLQEPDLAEWHQHLMDDATAAFETKILDVPDVRHVNNLDKRLGTLPTVWREQQAAPVGVWHCVPTNQYLSLNTPAILRLRHLVEHQYRRVLAEVEGIHEPVACISESWIQFYQLSDYKAFHNHERYGAPYPAHRWAGTYYIDDGVPDASTPYSSVFSFRIRESNQLLRPLPGLLLMWPADILHEAHPFYGSCNRVVVNFNINSDLLGGP